MVYVKGIVPLYKWKRFFGIASEIGLGKRRNEALSKVPLEFREEGTPYTRRVTLEELLRVCIKTEEIDKLLNASSQEVGFEIREVAARGSKDQIFGFTPRTSSLGAVPQLRMSIDLEVIPITSVVSASKYPLTRAQVAALLKASTSLHKLVPPGLYDKLREVRTDDLPLMGMSKEFINEICRILRGRLLSPDEWMFAAGVQKGDLLNNLLGSKSLREGSFPVGMPEGAVSPLGFRDIYDNCGVEVVSGMMDRTLLAMGVAPGEKEHKPIYYNEGRKIDENPGALITEHSFPLGGACLRIAFFGSCEQSTASEIISIYIRRGQPFGISWGLPLWLFLRDKYISGLKKLSKKIGKAGVGDKVVNFKSGEACVIVQCNKEKSEFVISSGLRHLFSIRGIREIQIKTDVSSDELFSVLRIAMRMRKEELLRGFIKSYTSSIILRSKKDYISVVLSKEGALKKGILTIEKLPELNGGPEVPTAR